MYEEYWGLTEKPFENTPDPRFLYYSPKHEEALVRMLYAVKERKGAGLLTGEYGSGKTLLSRVLVNELSEGNRHKIVLITYPQLSPVEFLKEIIYQLERTEEKGTKGKLLRRFQDILHANIKREKETVIIVDEAQSITSPSLLEEMRLLLNFQLEERFLLTLLFLGQPELLPKMEAIPQLRQRLAVCYHISGLDEGEASKYIEHRLRVAGAGRTIFTPGAVEVIHKYAGGVPRMINNIADLCLLIGSGEGAQEVDFELAERVSKEQRGGLEIRHGQIQQVPEEICQDGR